MITFGPFAHALGATLLAVARLAAFAALGATIVRGRHGPATLPAWVLVGAAVIGCSNGLLLRSAFADAALACDLALTVAALATRWRPTLAAARELFGPPIEALRRNRLALAVAALLLAIYWINAAAPPRDTDSLRYHLAQIATIDREGRWAPMPIPHYAFPFAWQSTYLPFVRLGVPEAAQLTSLGLFATGTAALHCAMRAPTPTGRTWALAAVALTLSTGVLTAFTTAAVDAYTMFVVLVLALLLVDERGDGPHLALTGFVAGVALGSRYQAAAIAIAATTAVGARALRARTHRRELVPFALGALAALALALPFYVANFQTFGNPVWPLLSGIANDPVIERVGAQYADTWSGARTPRQYGSAIWRLATDRAVFPAPLLIAAALWLGWRARDARRPLAWWLTAFLATWAVAQPMLYPRFVLYALPAATVLLAMSARVAGDAGAARAGRSLRIGMQVVMGALVIAFAAYTVAFTRFPAEYLLTGNPARYHRVTWYYRVFQWANAHTPPGARFLVVVSSGETFHLDRYYRRADPWHSAIVDWSDVPDGRALERVLRCGGFDYLLVEERDWGAYVGGDVVTAAAADAARRGLLRLEATFDLELTRSRFRRRSMPAVVRVYARGGARAGAIATGSCR